MFKNSNAVFCFFLDKEYYFIFNLSRFSVNLNQHLKNAFFVNPLLQFFSINLNINGLKDMLQLCDHS